MMRDVHPLRIAHDRARELRRDLTEPEKRLWARLRWATLRSRVSDGSFRSAPLSQTLLARLRDWRSNLTVRNTSSTRRRTNGERVYSVRTIIVLRFWNEEVLTNIEGVLERIVRELRAAGTISKARSG